MTNVISVKNKPLADYREPVLIKYTYFKNDVSKWYTYIVWECVISYKIKWVSKTKGDTVLKQNRILDFSHSCPRLKSTEIQYFTHLCQAFKLE